MEDDLKILTEFVPRAIGYTTAVKRLKWFRSQLAQHRKCKRTWKGTKEAYKQELEHLIERVGHYKNLLLRPDYAAKVRKAKLRKRRRIRRPLPSRSILTVSRYGNECLDEHSAHLAWMVQRVKKKRFKTMKHLAYVYRKSLRWIEEAKSKAIRQGLITEAEWQKSFRQPGRPRKGKPRGPYQKRDNSPTHNFA